MRTAINAMKDLTRPKCWTHVGLNGDPGYPKNNRPWVSRMSWRPFPWFGGDEWCRWTIVLPFPFYSVVIPVWDCRDPECEACEQDCLVRPS